jgi:hypothetical protein
MSTRTRVVVGIALLSSMVTSLRAQETVTAVLELDHGTGVVRLIESHPGKPTDTTTYGQGRTLQLPRPMNLRFRVVNTNTGLYEIRTGTTATASPAIAPVNAFLAKLGPYLPEIGLAISGPPRALGGAKPAPGRPFSDAQLNAAPSAELSNVWERARGAEQALLDVETRISGARGLQETLTLTLSTLEQMRRGAPADAAAAQLRASSGIPASGCTTGATPDLPRVQGLIGALYNLQRARQALDAGLGALPGDVGELWTPVRDTVVAVRGRVVSALGDFEPLVAAAYHVEQIAAITANACAQMDGGVLAISRLTGRTITVSIAPRAEPEINRVASRPAQVITITVVKKPFIRPSIGVSLINLPRAQFNVYGARAAVGGAEIYTASIRDARFAWGATVGTTWKCLDFRETHGIAFWLPELTVSAQPDVKGFGVGGGVSIGPIKLGSGVMWVKRVELSGLLPGQIIPSPQFLATREIYARPLSYWSLSIFGWPGFAAR